MIKTKNEKVADNLICIMQMPMNLVRRNQRLHNPESPLLIGDVKDCDAVKEINEPSYIDLQQKLL